MPYWITVTVALLSFIIAALIGKWLVPFLHKINFGQNIKITDGPSWHKNKQGTPIMGGFMFMVSSIITTIIGYIIYKQNYLDVTADGVNQSAIRLLACIIFSLLFSSIGFIDDYIKVVKKRNLGLTAKQKMLMQILYCGGFLAILYALGDKSTLIDFMFFKLDFGILYYPIMLLFMVFLSNSVNLTDGIDGLCGSVTVISMLSFAMICTLMNLNEISIYALALAGGCLGFLVWNLHPAKCFMGDTGSMFLGGAFVSIGMVTHSHLLIVLVGLIYVCEALSVVIQVTYFKITARQHYKKTGEKGKGKRIFKMSPIHHHFEMCGFSEYKIVITFSIVGLIAGALAVLYLAL